MIENQSSTGARDMHQLNLFETERPIPAPQPPNVPYIRKHLNRVLTIARAAQVMPWNPTTRRHWETFFPELAALLPVEEGAALCEAFSSELSRLLKR